MDSKEIREALDKAYDFKATDTHTVTRVAYEEWRDSLITALSTIDSEAIRRECVDIIRQWASVGTLLNENVDLLCAAILGAEPAQDDGKADENHG